MSLTVKAFFEKENGDTEIRRFPIPADVSSSYDYLFKKIQDIFPSLKTGNFTLFWKDPDGDHVLFSSDEELLEALGFVTDAIFKVYVRAKQAGEASDKGPLHQGVVCDGCQGAIYGNRYKCMECPDYDLCGSCEGKGTHKEHDMMKITSPNQGFPHHPPGFMPGFPGFPGGPHPGKGPGPFVPPPHFRRWMQRFMKRWHKRNAPGFCGEGEFPEDKPEEKAEEKEKAENVEVDEEDQETGEDDEYLRQVGESVASMLDPFGIDVTVDVEHHGKRRGRGGCRGGRGGRGGPWGCGRGWGPFGPPGGPFGPQGPWGPHMRPGCKARCKKNNPAEDVPMEASAPAEKQDTVPEKQTATDVTKEAEKQPGPESPMAEDTQQKDQGGDKPPAEDNTWTLLSVNGQNQSAGPSAPTPAPEPTPGQAYLYPPANPKIAEALHQMLSMGFNNDGGWLVRLLEAKDGDIVKVLDAIKPQPGRNNEGGTMA